MHKPQLNSPFNPVPPELLKGSKETATKFLEIAPNAKRLSVTVGTEAVVSGNKNPTLNLRQLSEWNINERINLPMVRSVGPILKERKKLTSIPYDHQVTYPRTPSTPVKPVDWSRNKKTKNIKIIE